MKPILYSADETDFSKNGIGILVDTISCVITEERNGLFELVMEYPITGQHAEHIHEDMIIKAIANDRDGQQLFRLYRSSKPISGITAWRAEHISYDLMYLPIDKPIINNKTAQTAIEQLLHDTPIENPFAAWSDITTRNSTSINEILSVRNALGGIEGSVLDVWGGEYQFDNFTIKLHKQRGNDNGVQIRYGKNLIDATQEKNIASVITAIYPYASYYDINTEEYITVTLPEKIIKTPLHLNYARLKCIPVDFTDTFEYDETITVKSLRAAATSYANSGIDVPDISIKASFINMKNVKDFDNLSALENVGMCDTVMVYVERLDINVKAKIVKYEYDSLNEVYESVEIGNTVSNLAREISKNERETEHKLKEVKSRTTQVRRDIDKTISQVTAAITGNSGGYVMLHPAENPQEIFIMDAEDSTLAKNVWRWNLSGLGHSSNGISGPYTTAITADGIIVADFIKAGEFDGLLIKAGTIKAESLDVAYTGAVNASIETLQEGILLKVSKGDVSTEISQESDKVSIKGNRLVVECDNFSISESGNVTIAGKITASSGKIANWNINENMLYREISETLPAFTTADVTAIQKIVVGITEVTETLLKKYDIDGDGFITLRDQILVQRIVQGIDSRIVEGRLEINSSLQKGTIALTGTSGIRGGMKTQIGTSGMYSSNVGCKYLTCENFICEKGFNGYISIGDKRITVSEGIITDYS